MMLFFVPEGREITTVIVFFVLPHTSRFKTIVPFHVSVHSQLQPPKTFRADSVVKQYSVSGSRLPAVLKGLQRCGFQVKQCYVPQFHKEQSVLVSVLCVTRGVGKKLEMHLSSISSLWEWESDKKASSVRCCLNWIHLKCKVRILFVLHTRINALYQNLQMILCSF